MGRIGLSVLIAAVGFLYLPLVVLTVFSFNDSALMAFPLSGFTLEWYRELAQNDNFLKGFVTSFLIAQPVGILAMLFGLMASLALTAPGFRWRGLFAILLLVPFLVPKSVLSIAQAMIMSRVGFERGATALILAQSLVALPFATALISAVMVRFDRRLIEAARDLGASPWQAFLRVLLPQIRPALSGAYSVGVILSLARPDHCHVSCRPNPAAVADGRLGVPARAQARPQRHASGGSGADGGTGRRQRALPPPPAAQARGGGLISQWEKAVFAVSRSRSKAATSASRETKAEPARSTMIRPFSALAALALPGNALGVEILGLPSEADGALGRQETARRLDLDGQRHEILRLVHGDEIAVQMQHGAGLQIRHHGCHASTRRRE